MAVKKRIDLIGIDWQNDFVLKNGRLSVPNAEQDAQNVANFIRKFGKNLTMIHMTQDSHHRTHIAHPSTWVGRDGKNPAPFTQITHKDLVDGTWRAADPRRQAWLLKYTEQLEKNGRYPLVVWPPHCIIGTEGHIFHKDVAAALEEWEDLRLRPVNIVTKGSNNDTEHYSAVQADVQIPTDPSTQLNTPLIDTIAMADEILCTGEALTHCMANTFTDIANNFGEENIKKLVLFTDCTSGIPGFEQLGQKFLTDLTKRGMRVTTSKDYLY